MINVHLPEGWTTAGNSLACNPHPLTGGIIDRELVSGKWFVIFSADLPVINNLASREAAFDALNHALAANGISC